MNRKISRQLPVLVWMFVFGFVGAIASLLVVAPDPAAAESDFSPIEHPRIYENVIGLPDGEDTALLLQKFVLKTQFPAGL
ncbi:hypothetical protein [Pseudanabaena sp. FACHB-2040]|uniref:hypothetical protein n=1 Tax=Pseudanabaena sp. FACHB-2040 TaxID=2692859 RepID=UPI00168214FB|nr:hypothetical protein [Pseudanabaena sp. FACHB-2040]MBD2257164.1 hypothetical protein [Pseudanabaena sp. FACHB-2040]